MILSSDLYQLAMKMGKHSKNKQQSGSGRAVLVTFYVTRPRRNKEAGGASAASSRQVHHHHHHHHLHHRLHGTSHEARRGSDRRADLLEYSRRLRATSATTPTAHPRPPLSPRRDIIKPVPAKAAIRHPLPPRRDIKAVTAVRHDDHPAARDDRTLVRAASLQEVRYRCLRYGGDWSWKKVLKLVLPCQNNNNDHQPSMKSKKRRDSVDNDSKKNSSTQAKAWPAAAQLVSKLKVNRMSRRRTSSSNPDEGLVKKLFSMFRQQSRPSR